MEGDSGAEKKASQPLEGDGQAGESDTGNVPKSVFSNTQPMREDQVQNAVKFLLHPKVRGSAVMHRRSFLEKKGLTKEEIDEAFRRAPDPQPNATSAPEGQLEPSTNGQPQTYAQPVAVPQSSAGVLSTVQKPWFRWTHVLLSLGVFCGVGAGSAVLIKNAIIPRLKSWILKIVAEENAKKARSKQSIEEIVIAAAKTTEAAVSDVAKLSQDMLSFKTEERKYFDKLMEMFSVQVDEMKSIGDTIRNLKTEKDSSSSMMKSINGPPSITENKRSVSPSSPLKSEAPPHPKSYMEIMAMIQRGETPPGIKEINDQPPNPNQPLPRSQLIPKTKPWEAPQHDNGYSQSQYLAQGSHVDVNENGAYSLSNGNSYSSTLGNNGSEPWWQRKTVTISEIQPNEVEERLPEVRRSWAPPPPPGVKIPEAAVAIRQPKSTDPKNHLNIDQLAVSRAVENTQEQQPMQNQPEGTQAPITEEPKSVELEPEIRDGPSSSSSMGELWNDNDKRASESCNANTMDNGFGSLLNENSFLTTLEDDSSKPWWEGLTVNIPEIPLDEVECLEEVPSSEVSTALPSIENPNDDHLSATLALENQQELDQTEEEQIPNRSKFVKLESMIISDGVSSLSLNIKEQLQGRDQTVESQKRLVEPESGFGIGAASSLSLSIIKEQLVQDQPEESQTLEGAKLVEVKSGISEGASSLNLKIMELQHLQDQREESQTKLAEEESGMSVNIIEKQDVQDQPEESQTVERTKFDELESGTCNGASSLRVNIIEQQLVQDQTEECETLEDAKLVLPRIWDQ